MRNPSRKRVMGMRRGLVVLMAAVCAGGCGGSGSSSSSDSGGVLLRPSVTTLTNLNTVTNPQVLENLVESGSLISCYPGSTVTFASYKIFGSDAAGLSAMAVSPSSLNWSSSNANLATVNGGVVNCVANGVVQISATIPNAKCDDSCTASGAVLVTSSKDTLTLEPATGTLKVGDPVDFTVTLNTEVSGGAVTHQDVSTSISILTSSDNVLTPSGTNNQFKASKSGTAWGYAQYQFADHVAVSNVFSITVQ